MQKYMKCFWVGDFLQEKIDIFEKSLRAARRRKRRIEEKKNSIICDFVIRWWQQQFDNINNNNKPNKMIKKQNSNYCSIKQQMCVFANNYFHWCLVPIYYFLWVCPINKLHYTFAITCLLGVIVIKVSLKYQWKFSKKSSKAKKIKTRKFQIKITKNYLDLRPEETASSCMRTATRAGGCFSYDIFSIPVDDVDSEAGCIELCVELLITLGVAADKFCKTLWWLLFGVLERWLFSDRMEVCGDWRPGIDCCWIIFWWGLERWLLSVLFVKCWYKLPPCVGRDDAGDEDCCCCCCCGVWLDVTIVEILLLELLLLLLEGKFMPGTVAGKGTDTTKLSACCLSSFTVTFCCVFAWTFGVITCDLLLLLLLLVTADDDVVVVAVVFAVCVWNPTIEPVDWITFGLTFCRFKSVVGVVDDVAVTVLLVDDDDDDEFVSVRA